MGFGDRAARQAVLGRVPHGRDVSIPLRDSPRHDRNGRRPLRRRSPVRFAKVVFIGAGIWGLVVLTPLYWLVDITGRGYGAPMEYPQFFYGFMSVALAWQMAFLVI